MRRISCTHSSPRASRQAVSMPPVPRPYSRPLPPKPSATMSSVGRGISSPITCVPTWGGFWNNYTDLQLGAFNPTTASAALVNTGKSVIKGGEFELHGRFAGLQLDMGGAYVNSRLGAITLVDTETLPP